jgi:hypothetical protein
LAAIIFMRAENDIKVLSDTIQTIIQMQRLQQKAIMKLMDHQINSTKAMKDLADCVKETMTIFMEICDGNDGRPPKDDPVYIG